MNISLAAEPIFNLGSFRVTNAVFTSWLVSLLLIALAFVSTRSLALIPGKLQNVVEVFVGAFHDLVESVAKEKTLMFFPLIATFFFFILFSNWLGLLPGFGSIGIYENIGGHKTLVPFFRAATSDLNTTMALALIAVVSIQFFGIKEIGLKAHLGKFFINPLKKPIEAFVGILEFVLEFAKILSFAFRLFGNIFAGEVLLTVITFLIPVIAPLPFLGLEVFVGFIQALVFALLTLVFVQIATTSHAHNAKEVFTH